MQKWISSIKKTLRYAERNPESRLQYLSQLRQIIKERGKQSLVYIDESGFEEHAYRTSGWAKRGAKVYGDRPGNNRCRTNLIGARQGKKFLAPMLYEGSTTASLLNKWLENSLFKEIPEGATVIMDNAAFHKTASTRELFENSPFHLLYLPPYSPDFNPIENDFAILKKKRKFLPPQTKLDEIIKQYGLFLE